MNQERDGGLDQHDSSGSVGRLGIFLKKQQNLLMASVWDVKESREQMEGWRWSLTERVDTLV